jgi:hypothetical protein
MYGIHVNTLNVYLSSDTTNLTTPIWSRKGTQGNQWRMGQFQIAGDSTTSSVTNVIID